MATEAQGTLVVTEISEDSKVTWKVILCEIDSQASDSAGTTETKTKCGSFVATSVDPTKISGNGVAVGNVSGAQLSYARIVQLTRAKTKIWCRRQNAADTPNLLSAGEITYHLFQGYFSNVTETSAEGDIIKFTYEITSSGDVDVDPNS